MNNDIITGHAPDLMILDRSELSVSAYADKGVLEDLNPYLESDGTVNRSDLQENILAAFAPEGKLYGMPLSYSIHTLMGRTSVVGEESGWTLAELNILIDRIGDERQVFEVYDKATILMICMTANSNDLINRDNPEQGFDRETVMKILEFANRFPPEQREPYDQVLYDRITKGTAHVTAMAFGDVLFYHALQSAFWSEPVTLMGYPSESGNGLLASSRTFMAINSQCPNKEGAWQFISSMLSDDFQEKKNGEFPILKSSLEKQMEQAMEAVYITDENGNQQEVPHSRVSVGGSESRDIFAAKEQELQALREAIDSITTAMESDMLETIISEEAPAYFSGRRSVEEVTDIVQNRIQLYLAEM